MSTYGIKYNSLEKFATLNRFIKFGAATWVSFNKYGMSEQTASLTRQDLNEKKDRNSQNQNLSFVRKLSSS